MGIFSLTQEIAVDLGTANTIIIHNDKIVVDEPSYVALDSKGKLVAVGEKAKMMQGKEHPGIRTIRPLRDGVIADFNAAELMIRGLIKMVSSKHHWFSPSLRIVVCIPSGSTEVEIRAVRDSSEHAGGRDVYMIYEPMAAALGIGLDVEAPEGNMIVDIGGGTTEIAVISLGGIVTNKSIRVAGDVLTEDIQEHMRRAHSMKVGERMAELIKINVGSTLTEMDNPPEDYIVHGPNQMTALPMEVPVSYQEIYTQNRGSYSERIGEHTTRTLCRHCQKRHLYLGRRRASPRSRQASVGENRHQIHCSRRSSARSGEGHRHRVEEPRQVLVSHPIAFTHRHKNSPRRRQPFCLRLLVCINKVY